MVLMDWALELRNLSHRYRQGRWRTDALIDFNLTVAAGECVALLGHNGAGKTTTIKIVLGFLRPSSGSVRVLGEDLARNAPARRHLAYIPENVRFHPHLSPAELFSHFAGLNGMSLSASRIDEMLDAVHLPPSVRERRIATFSKGMNQRLALALLSLKDARVLILDEPASGLDPSGRRLLREIIREQRSRGAAVLISSHELAEVEPLADRVAVLKQGRLLELAHVSLITRRNRRFQLRFAGDQRRFFRHLDLEMEMDGHETRITTDRKEMAAGLLELGVRQGLKLLAYGTLDYSLEDYYLDTLGMDA